VKLLIVHHRFRPGGVRRVIELATPHLLAYWRERVRAVVLATGEAAAPPGCSAVARACLSRQPDAMSLADE